jgi:hypothetical protein
MIVNDASGNLLQFEDKIKNRIFTSAVIGSVFPDIYLYFNEISWVNAENGVYLLAHCSTVYYSVMLIISLPILFGFIKNLMDRQKCQIEVIEEE